MQYRGQGVLGSPARSKKARTRIVWSPCVREAEIDLAAKLHVPKDLVTVDRIDVARGSHITPDLDQIPDPEPDRRTYQPDPKLRGGLGGRKALKAAHERNRCRTLKLTA